MVKKLVKDALARFLPGFYMELKARRARAHSEKLEQEWGCSELTRKMVEKHGPTVRRGPFAGLKYNPETHHRHLTPKLIGAYESELHDVWKEVLENDYSQLINVGSAEGYYAIGMALHYPRKTVHAFDTDSWARQMNRSMAKLNEVDNLEIHGACLPAWLLDNLREGAFILCDCEGFEDQLLDPEQVPQLLHSYLLVELHESPSPGVTQRMMDRFGKTHKLTIIGVQEKNPSDYPELDGLSRKERQIAVSDLRFDSGQKWLWAKRE